MRSAPTIILLTLLVAVTGSRAAEAGDERRAAVIVQGDARHVDGIRSDVTAWLTRAAWTIASGATVDRATDAAGKCLGDAARDCSTAIRAVQVGRLWLVSAREERVDGDHQLVITASAFGADGRLLATDRRYCDACGDDGRREAVDELLAAIDRSISAQSGATTILRIRSRPPGATISVDGAGVGLTAGTDALQIEVTPGPHTITADAPGHRLESRQIEAREGDVHEIDLELQRVVPPPPGRGPLPWIVTGVGLAALVGGVVLIAADEDATADGRSNYRYSDTMVPGVALTAVGAAGTAFGAYLFARGPAKRQPIVAMSADGAWLGYGGSF